LRGITANEQRRDPAPRILVDLNDLQLDLGRSCCRFLPWRRRRAGSGGLRRWEVLDGVAGTNKAERQFQVCGIGIIPADASPHKSSVPRWPGLSFRFSHLTGRCRQAYGTDAVTATNRRPLVQRRYKAPQVIWAHHLTKGPAWPARGQIQEVRKGCRGSLGYCLHPRWKTTRACPRELCKDTSLEAPQCDPNSTPGPNNCGNNFRRSRSAFQADAMNRQRP
jgi:hypothetical protein